MVRLLHRDEDPQDSIRFASHLNLTVRVAQIYSSDSHTLLQCTFVETA